MILINPDSTGEVLRASLSKKDSNELTYLRLGALTADCSSFYLSTYAAFTTLITGHESSSSTDVWTACADSALKTNPKAQSGKRRSSERGLIILDAIFVQP